MNPYEILRTQLAHAIEPVKEGSTDRIVDAVLRTLEQQRLVSYASGTDIRLLSVAGRVLIAILENPGITQRALGQYLGMTEGHVSKVLKNLDLAGLLVTTKSGKEKTHRLAGPEALRHPDISRFFDAIAAEVRRMVGDSDSPA